MDLGIDGKSDHCLPGYFWRTDRCLSDEQHSDAVHKRRRTGFGGLSGGSADCFHSGRGGLQKSDELLCALGVLFVLRPTWLLSAFDSVLSALALFDPFNGVVGGMFSISAIVYYLSVIALFLFLTGQALERRRWN